MSREKIIQIATGEIGITEFPAGSNKTPFGEWFNLNGVQWCAIFCSWVYDHAGHPLKGDFAKGFASVPYLFQHAPKTSDPLPGDLVIFDWQKGKVAETPWSGDHVGIFKGWLDRKAGTFESIEGNTSVSNQSNGGAVMKRQRNLANVQGFINPLGLPA